MSSFLSGTTYTLSGTANAVAGTQALISITNPITKRPSYAREVVVRNTGATNALRVYLGMPGDGFLTVAANTSERVNGTITRLALTSAAATTTYELVITAV